MSDTSRVLVQHGTALRMRGADPVDLGTVSDRGTSPPPGEKLRAIGQLLLRRRRLIVTSLILLNAVSISAVREIPPRYTAAATVIIGPRQAQVVDLKDVITGLTGDSDVIESEVQVLHSRRIARSVVQDLHLDKMPEFNPELRAPGLVSRVLASARGQWSALMARLEPLRASLTQFAGLSGSGTTRMPVVAAAKPAPTDGLPAPDPLAATVDDVLHHLWVTPKGHSRVIEVAFDSGNPVLAAKIANAFAGTYIADQLKAKLDATAHANQWLDDRVAELRERVINADQAVEAYRRRAGITHGRTGTLMSEQISTLGEQSIQAQIARANAEARLQALTGAGGGVGQDLSSIPEVAGSPTIQALRVQETTLLAQAAEVSRTLGDAHPKSAAIHAELAAVQGRIRSEIGKVAASLQDQARTARAREAALTHNLSALRQDVDTADAREVELRALQHEADADRALYDRLLTRAKETNVETGLQHPDAQVISPAETPAEPSFPKPAIIIPLFFAASLLATALLVFGMEGLDYGFTSPEQVEEMLGVAALGVIPQLKGSRRRSPSTYILEHPSSPFGEAIRSLHTSLMLSSVDQPPKVVLVASALPDEGKTSVVLSLARLMASCGKRVVVVDCDLRRPELHRAFGIAQGPGLVDCLKGDASVLDVLKRDVSSPAYLVPAGAKAYAAPDLLGSESMRKLLATLADCFDLVLLDSAPVLAVSDTRNLCRLADKTVFMVRWQDTRRFAVVPALRQIIEAGGDLAGVLLSRVNLSTYLKHSSIGIYQRRIGLYLSK